jgi:hypothetical protein
VDIDSILPFGGPTSPIVAPQERRLTSTNTPQAVHEYTKHMQLHFEVHRILEKVAALCEKSDIDQWSAEEIIEWGKIDDILDQGRRAAENKCAARRSGQYPWSPELDRAGSRLSYWQLWLREFTSKKNNLSTLNDLATAANIPESSRIWQTSKFVRRETRRARRVLKKVQKDADILHEQHLAETAKFSAIVHNMDESAARVAIEARELTS